MRYEQKKQEADYGHIFRNRPPSKRSSYFVHHQDVGPKSLVSLK